MDFTTVNKLHKEIDDVSDTSTTAQSQAPSTDRPKFLTICRFCHATHKFCRTLLNKWTWCQCCCKLFLARETPVKDGGKTSQRTLSTMETTALIQKRIVRSNLVVSTPKNQIQPQEAQPQTVPLSYRPSFWARCPFCMFKHRFERKLIKKSVLCSCKKTFVAIEVNSSSLQQKQVPSKNPSTHFSGKESSPGLSCDVSVGEKRKRTEYGENHNAENCSVVLRPESVKQVSEVDGSKGPMSKTINPNQRTDRNQSAQVGAVVGNFGNLEVDKNSGLGDSGTGGAVQSTISECAGPKFNNFDKLREEVEFTPFQAWALYDPVDGMPRQYALIRKVLTPGFGLRITYLEPDPDDEKEVQWFEEELPVSAGKFRLGKNENTKDRSKFSHVIRCSEGSKRDHFSIIPRKGETWALFKNWDINWSSEPDSHRKFEYEFVEILSDYDARVGVSVAFLYKAKGFASVFFRMGTGNADVFHILPRSLYQFSHRIPSFQKKRVGIKGVPKDAYELDQAALPKTIEERIVPSHLLAKPKPEALIFPRNGKVFQTGQIWSFYSGSDNLPLYYCRIQKITLIQAVEQEAVFKLSVNRFKATSFPENVIQWEDKKMPVGCGTFLVTTAPVILAPDHASHQILPQISWDGNEYTVLPKIGEVWAIYRSWTSNKEFKDVGYCDYDIVEVLDDSLDYKVVALEHALFFSEDEEKKTLFREAESRHPDCDDEDGSEVIFTIPKLKMLRFSHQIPGARVTREINGDMEELFEVESRALPTNVKSGDH